MIDLVIIGAGPAGITAAVYAARKQIPFAVLTDDVGGQAALSSDIENYTGYQFMTGVELISKFEEHLRQFHVELKKNAPVRKIERSDASCFLLKTDSVSYETRSVIIASGRRPRWLDCAGEEKFRNRGVSYCATCDGPLFSKKTVAVVGGGNAALDAALQMIKIADHVYVVDINPELAGDAVMRQAVERSPKVEVLKEAQTQEIFGGTFVEGIRVVQKGRPREIKVQGVFVEIGSIPNSGMIDFVDKNSSGEIIVDCFNRASHPGIFAAGDVTNVPEKQIIVAAGEGAKAMLGVSRYLAQLKM